VPRATPAEVYEVVTDFGAYPRLFSELKATRILSKENPRVRVEFRAEVVLPVRYVLDLVCDSVAPSVNWTFVEGEIVTGSTGGWRFAVEGDGTRVDYFVALEIKAPLPGFVLRKVTDALVAASIPKMFESLAREVAARKGKSSAG
jgi:ribosome-associated toxin RatA of RatAB toxin-antitoxin module